MVIIFIMSAKMTTLDLVKIKLYQNKVYDVINTFQDADVANKILSRDSNYTADTIIM